MGASCPGVPRGPAMLRATCHGACARCISGVFPSRGPPQFLSFSSHLLSILPQREGGVRGASESRQRRGSWPLTCPCRLGLREVPSWAVGLAREFLQPHAHATSLHTYAHTHTLIYTHAHATSLHTHAHTHTRSRHQPASHLVQRQKPRASSISLFCFQGRSMQAGAPGGGGGQACVVWQVLGWASCVAFCACDICTGYTVEGLLAACVGLSSIQNLNCFIGREVTGVHVTLLGSCFAAGRSAVSPCSWAAHELAAPASSRAHPAAQTGWATWWAGDTAGAKPTAPGTRAAEHMQVPVVTGHRQQGARSAWLL